MIVTIQMEAKNLMQAAGTYLLPHCGQIRFMMKVLLRDIFIVYNGNIEITLFHFFLHTTIFRNFLRFAHLHTNIYVRITNMDRAQN